MCPSVVVKLNVLISMIAGLVLWCMPFSSLFKTDSLRVNRFNLDFIRKHYFTCVFEYPNFLKIDIFEPVNPLTTVWLLNGYLAMCLWLLITPINSHDISVIKEKSTSVSGLNFHFQIPIVNVMILYN